jgi:hypothetical protein
MSEREREWDARQRDAELRLWAREDWGEALELAELWASYWTDEPVVRLSTAQAGFLSRTFLAALERLWYASGERDKFAATLARIVENAEDWHGPREDTGHEKALAVIAAWAREALGAQRQEGGYERERQEGEDAGL